MNDMKPKKQTTIRSSKELGHALRQSRLNGTMTQSDIANRSGTKQNAISRIEGGHMGRTMNLLFIRPRSKSSADDIESLFP